MTIFQLAYQEELLVFKIKMYTFLWICTAFKQALIGYYLKSELNHCLLCL